MRSHRPAVLLETLESRVLLSVCPSHPSPAHAPPTPPSPVISADLGKLKAAGARFVADLKAGLATLKADLNALRNGSPAVDPQIVALQARLAADQLALAPLLAGDQAAIDAVNAQYDALLTADHAILDAALDDTARSNAQARLSADQNSYMSDVSAVENQLTRDSAPIAADQYALQLALDANPAQNGDPKAQLATDRSALRDTLKADGAAITAARKQLSMDLQGSRPRVLASCVPYFGRA